MVLVLRSTTVQWLLAVIRNLLMQILCSILKPCFLLWMDFSKKTNLKSKSLQSGKDRRKKMHLSLAKLSSDSDCCKCLEALIIICMLVSSSMFSVPNVIFLQAPEFSEIINFENSDFCCFWPSILKQRKCQKYF